MVKTRENTDRTAQPSYAIIDSQSVKTVANSEERGIDGGKAKGRKMFWYSKIGTVSAKKIWGRKMGKHYPNKYKNSSNLADCSGQEK